MRIAFFLVPITKKMAHDIGDLEQIHYLRN